MLAAPNLLMNQINNKSLQIRDGKLASLACKVQQEGP